MPRFKFLAFTNPVEGREDEYNDWYTNTHLPDLLRVPGLMTAQRFRLTKTQKGDRSHPWKYLGIYDCEADDPKQVIDGIRARSGTPEMPQSTAVAADHYSIYFEPITEVIHRKS
jgi:hypothetical protein